MDNTQERDLILRAKEATEIGVSLGAFARAQGLSYRELVAILDGNGVRREKRTVLVLPADFAADEAAYPSV